MERRRAKPAGISADAIVKGTRFGWWEVLNPEPVRRQYSAHGNSHTNPPHLFIRCRCTKCGITEREVRRTYLLNGHSTSCGCRAAPAEKE